MLKSAWRTLLGTLTGAADRDPLGSALGHLECQVMEVVWRGDRLTVKDVHARLPRAIAYTTVMTTLDRLFKKGLLDRERDGRAFVYRAVFTREDARSAVASEMIRGLLAGAPGRTRPVLSHLVDVITERDAALLDELERLVRERRRRSRSR